MAESAMASLLVGGCVGGIGMLLKSNANQHCVLADAMARTPTTPVDEVRRKLQASHLPSVHCEMYGETWTARPIMFKERPCLVQKDITTRVYNTHFWREPLKDSNGKITRKGCWIKEERSTVMSEDVTGEELLTFREAGTVRRIADAETQLHRIQTKLQSQGSISNVLAMTDKANLASLQQELDDLNRSAAVTVGPGVSLDPFYTSSGSSFTATTSVNVNVNVNSGESRGSQPADEALGTRLVTKVIPAGKQLYALGSVSCDVTNPNDLVLSNDSTRSFLLKYGGEGALSDEMRASAYSQDLLGSLLCGVGGACLVFSAVSFANASSSNSTE